jgi:hypothetical protein
VGFSFIEFIDIQTPTFDEASQKREERNMQQWIRRAEMSSEQREEMKRKQREYMRDYRAWKKAKCVTTEHGRRLNPKIVALLVL